MNYKEALKEVEKQKRPESGYLSIELGYTNFLLPYKEGTKLLEILEKAIIYERGFSQPPKFSEVSSLHLSINVIPTSEYKHARMGELLGIPFEDVLQMKREHELAQL